MDIIARIEEVYPRMTKKQKQLADYMVSHTGEMAFITLKELSKEVGITEITVLNMCRTMGYASFNEVKYEFRKHLNQNRSIGFYRANEYVNTAVPDYELEHKEKVIAEICREEVQLVEELVRGFDVGRIFQIAEWFLRYQKIVLCGRGLSFILCEYLASMLSSMVMAVPVNTELNDAVYSVVPSMDENMLFVAFSFPDYYFMTGKLAEYARGRGAKILAVTDDANSELGKLADETLIVRSTTRLALNTLSAPGALINLLVSAIRLSGGIDRAESVGSEFGKIFED